MDLQQTVQDLAEAWVAASTDTSFSRTQLQVYGSGGAQGEGAEDGTEPSTSGEGEFSNANPMRTPSSPPRHGLPSRDSLASSHSRKLCHLQVYGSGGAQGEGAEEGTEPSTSGEGEFSSANPMGTPSSPPPHGLPSGDSLASSHSRKRKQSSPQPRREGSEPTAGPAGSGNKGNPPPSKRVKDSGGKMLPVHCIVELLDTPPSKGGGGTNKGVEEEKRREGYAIVPSTLQLTDLVRVALSKLDYPPERAKNATGVIQVRNWKALPFSSITDNQQSSVGQLFGDLLSHITLKISVLSSDASSANCRDQAPEDLSRSGKVGGNASSSILSLGNLGNSFFLRRGLDLPFGMMARRMKGGDGKGVGRTAHPVQELRIKLLQVLEKRGPTLLVSHGCPFSQVTVAQILQGKYNKPVSIEKIQAFYQWYNIYNGLTDNTLLPADRVDSSALPRISSKHWRRPRTLFNPRTELPRLLRWYRQNPRPTRAEMEVYLAELNSSDFRRNGTPLQYSSIMIWFKNARVKYRHLLRSSAIAQMREDIAYAKNSKDLVIDESKDNSDEEEDDMLVEEKEMEEQGEEEEDKTETLEASSSKSPLRSSVKSPSRSPGKSPVRVLHLKEEPIMEGEDCVGNENQSVSVATSVAKPTILPSLLHMQARPHLQPVSIVSNGLIVPSRLHNGSHQTETALHVPDIRKIASGFGISLTPELAAAAHAMPIPGLTHPHFLHALDSVHKDSPSVRLDYHNSALSVPKPTPSPLTTPSASQRRTPTPQSYKSQAESPKSEKSPQTTISQTSTTTATRVPRKRFTIDPTFEVPKLQSWFAIDPRPDRQTIERYVQELNSSEWRRHQPKYNNRVVYVWFKNARAKYSKMQISSGDRDPDMERRHHELMRMHQEAQMS